jgi:hypothetical protein
MIYEDIINIELGASLNYAQFLLNLRIFSRNKYTNNSQNQKHDFQSGHP